MEIRLIGTSEEIEAAMSVIQQSFTIHHDGGSYKGRNPRYASQNQSDRIRKLVVSPRAIAPRTAPVTTEYQTHAPVVNNSPLTPRSTGVLPLEVD